MSKYPTQSYWTADRPGTALPIYEQTSGQLLAEAVADAGAKDAVIYKNGVRWTWSQVQARAEALAHGLLAQGLQPGDHVAVWAPNVPEWITLQWGTAVAGLVLVTVNPAYRDAELAYILNHSDAKALFFEPSGDRSRTGMERTAIFDAAFRRGLPVLQSVFAMDEIPQLFREGNRQALPTVTPGDVCMIQYTSGTTGFPKGAMLTHRGIINNARGISFRRGDAPGSRLVHGMPFFHAGGCIAHTLLSAVVRGAQLPVQKFDVEQVLALIAEERATHFLAVPTMLQLVLDHPRRAEYDLSSLRDVTVGGAPVPVDLAESAQREFGCQFTIVFGQTEASPIITQTVPSDPPERTARTVGVPLPHLEMRLCDPLTGAVVETGTVGEICVRGYAVMAGYYKHEGSSEGSSIDEEGWLHTGDLGRMDAQGYLNVVGRLKDMVIRGGENIYPVEVENELRQHPAVVEAYVIGVPDQHYGEELCAAVKTRSEITGAQLQAFLKDRLARYKVPRYVCFLSNFPMTASGKVQKFVLRSQLIAELGLESQLRPTA